MIIGVVNQKGGTGKTTLAINLADAFSRSALRVLLLDADPQQSVISWNGVKNNARFSIQAIGDDDISDIVHSARRSYDRIIIDAPPSVTRVAESILSHSDQVIVPIGPSPLDIWSSKGIVELIRRTKSARKDLNVRMLICKTIVGTRLSKEARNALQGFGIHLFRTQISQRIAFIEAMIAGRSVLDYAPESMAAQEILSLYDEIV